MVFNEGVFDLTEMKASKLPKANACKKHEALPK